MLRRNISVFEAADIREWRGHDVVDAGGHKIGALEATNRERRRLMLGRRILSRRSPSVEGESPLAGSHG
jgi:hypothetical protein